MHKTVISLLLSASLTNILFELYDLFGSFIKPYWDWDANNVIFAGKYTKLLKHISILVVNIILSYVIITYVFDPSIYRRGRRYFGG